MNLGNELHLPVMLAEAITALAIHPDGTYVDCTFGRGGHSREILGRLGPQGRLFGIDKDPAALESAEATSLCSDPRVSLVHGSFATLLEIATAKGFAGRVDGILMDLGVSSPQLDAAARGFSFSKDGPLDMRMNTTSGLTASEWIDQISEEAFIEVLRTYGEERFAKRIAKAVLAARPVKTTKQLAELVEQAIPVRDKHKHPATRSFQAIRIALNRELEDLEQGLVQAVDVLAPGGRLVVIAFHSLEDRIVKRFIREQERGKPQPARLPVLQPHHPKLKALGKAMMPSEAEIQANVRARSAVMRVAERV